MEWPVGAPPGRAPDPTDPSVVGAALPFTEAGGVDRGLGPALHSHLREKVGDVVLHGLLGEEHAIGDLAVGEALGEQIEDATFLIGQPFELLVADRARPQTLEHPGSDTGVEQGLTGRDLADRVDEIHGPDLLEDVSRRTGHDGVEQCLVVGVGREHQAMNGRHPAADLTADLDTVAIGQADIEHRDIRVRHRQSPQGLLGGPGLGHDLHVTGGLEKLTQATTDDLVVVEQEHLDGHGDSLPANASPHRHKRANRSTTSTLPEVTEPSVDPKDLQHLLDAIVTVGSELSLPVVLRRIVETATQLVDARYGALGVLDESGTHLSQFLHTGIDDETVAAIGDTPSGHGILGLLIIDPRPIRLPDLSAHPESFGFPPNHPPMSSFLGVPIRVRGQVFGNLYLTGKRDDEEFTAGDEELVVGLATAAGVAIENARLHARVGELRVVEDRERIARDLHDTVIQRIFAIGLALQGMAARADDAETIERLQRVVDDLDDTARHIRTTVFALQRPRIPGRSIRQEVLDLVDEITDNSPIVASVRFDGPIDLTVPEQIADHLVAIVGEAVTNAVRHSGAVHLEIDVSVSDVLEAQVVDDGSGIDDIHPEGNGLRNLRSRATDLGGECVIGRSASGGTSLVWRVPV
jgi:signal transduction histidine kinase